MAQKSLGSWLRETVRLPGLALEVLIPKLMAEKILEVRQLKTLREAGGLEALFLDRPGEMQAVSAALDQLYPPVPPVSAADAPPEPQEPSQSPQAARTVAVPATTSWRPPPADAPAVFMAVAGSDGSQAPTPPSPQSMGVPGGKGKGSPSPAPRGPSTTQVKAGVADHAAAAMAQAGAAAAAAATASAAMVQSPALRPAPPPVPSAAPSPAAAPRLPPARPPPFPPAIDPIQVRAAAAAADARREGGFPPQPPARRESGPPPQPRPALPESPPQQPTRSPTEPLCGFVPYQLSAEMYANIYRNPAAFGYPEVASGTVARPKFGYIFVEIRTASGRRPKLLDGLDWIPSSATNAKHKLLRDGKTELVRQYSRLRTKPDAAKAAATAWGHFVREVVDSVKAENPGKTSYEIKAITGDRWRALPENDPIKVRSKAAAAEQNRFHRRRLARADPAQLDVESAVLADSQLSARPSRGSLPAPSCDTWPAAALSLYAHGCMLSHIRLHALSHTVACSLTYGCRPSCSSGMRCGCSRWCEAPARQRSRPSCTSRRLPPRAF